jgi:predicted transcriptional regulator of viral defense system
MASTACDVAQLLSRSQDCGILQRASKGGYRVFVLEAIIQMQF